MIARAGRSVRVFAAAETIGDIRQLVFRPALTLDPYWTGALGLYLCSASTQAVGGVHGMAGYHAARPALRRDLR